MHGEYHKYHACINRCLQLNYNQHSIQEEGLIDIKTLRVKVYIEVMINVSLSMVGE